MDKISFIITPDTIPLADNTLDFVFSRYVIEHIHPDDCARHLQEVRRVMKPGGQYIMMMPHPSFGPSDISKHFLKRGQKSQGLHLKEYSYQHMVHTLNQCGFQKIQSPIVSEYFFRILPFAFLYRWFLWDVHYKLMMEKFLPRIRPWAISKIIAKIFRVHPATLVFQK